MTESENNRFAHDLRNSLSAIYSYTQMLELLLDTPTTTKELDIARSINESAKKMNALIKAHEDTFRSKSAVPVTINNLSEKEGSAR